MCAALIERARTGIGTHVDLALFDVQISMLTYLASWQRNRGATFSRTENSAHPSLVPAQNFRTADGHLALFIGNDGMWRRFVQALADPFLADDRFTSREGRWEHRDEVLGRVQEILLGATSREWETRLAEWGVACGAVNDVAGALAEPQTRARGLLVQRRAPGVRRATSTCAARFLPAVATPWARRLCSASTPARPWRGSGTRRRGSPSSGRRV